jgi:type IV secretion system protein VirB1
MSHLVDVESGGNPFAIGVVGGQLVRQPKNLDEALATAKTLESQGYNYSVGLTQINRANLARYGLDTLTKAFDPCANMMVGSRILDECYTQSGNDWGKAFSCYYSGNFVTGFRDGYVRKIYDSIGRSIAVADASRTAAAIPLQPDAAHASPQATRPLPPAGSAAYRIAIRSVALDTTASVFVESPAAKPIAAPVPPNQPPSPAVKSSAPPPPPQAPLPSPAAQTGIFVPKVTVLGTSSAPGNSTQPATAGLAKTSATKQDGHPAEGADNAFVF